MRKLTKAQQAEHAEALEWFRKNFPPGSTLYTVLRNVSRSGMTRHIGLVGFLDGERRYPVHPNYSGSLLYGSHVNKCGDGIVVSGCGMDMGFNLVYVIAYAVHGDGYAYQQEWL